MTAVTSIAGGAGEGAHAPLPDEFRRWHWGAFLLSWIWGLGNGTYLALLALPAWFMVEPVWGRLDFPLDWIACGAILIVVPVWLGLTGYDLAWRNRSWPSVDEFRRVQRSWSRWGVGLVLGSAAAVALLTGFVFYALQASFAYEASVQRLRQSPDVAAVLGAPIEVGRFPWGRISIVNDGGSAALTFSVSGPKGRARAYVEAIRRRGAWSLDKVLLRLDEGDVIDVLGRLDQRATNGSTTPTRRPG